MQMSKNGGYDKNRVETEHEKAMHHKILEKNRRDGLRIEYDRLKFDLGLCAKTKQVQVLRTASNRLVQLPTSRDSLSRHKMRTPKVGTLQFLMEEIRDLDKEINDLEVELDIQEPPLAFDSYQPSQRHLAKENYFETEQLSQKNLAQEIFNEAETDSNESPRGYYNFLTGMQLPYDK